MLKLYLVRHGETDWNADGRIQGHSDIELNARGQEQARRLAERIVEEGAFDAIYASPLKRAYKTAELMSTALRVPLTTDARLLERSLGQLEGLSLEQIRVQFPEVHRAWNGGGVRRHIPGEETREVFVERTRGFINDLRARHPAGSVIAVTHGGTINMLLMTGLGLDIERPLPFDIYNASISIVRWGERGARLRGLNDVGHLSSRYAPPVESDKAQTDQRINAAEVQ